MCNRLRYLRLLCLPRCYPNQNRNQRFLQSRHFLQLQLLCQPYLILCLRLHRLNPLFLEERLRAQYRQLLATDQQIAGHYHYYSFAKGQ